MNQQKAVEMATEFQAVIDKYYDLNNPNGKVMTVEEHKSFVETLMAAGMPMLSINTAIYGLAVAKETNEPKAFELVIQAIANQFNDDLKDSAESILNRMARNTYN